MEPLYNGHIGSTILVLITEVSSNQRSFNTLQCYTGTQNGVLIIEVSTFQRFEIERFQCIKFSITCSIDMSTSMPFYDHFSSFNTID